MSIFSILIILGTMALALMAQAYVKSMVHRYHQVPGTSGYTGAEVVLPRFCRGTGFGECRFMNTRGSWGTTMTP